MNAPPAPAPPSGRPTGLDYDRRLMPRLFVRAFLAVAGLASAWALVRGDAVPLLAGVRPEILGILAWVLAVVHGCVGVAILVPALRRPAVATLLAALLGWMAFLGATARYAPAFGVGVLVVVTLAAAPPEDEGVWRRRDRGLLAEGAWLVLVVGLALLARWTLDSDALAWVVLPTLGAALHVRALSRLRVPRPFAAVLLRWLALFGAGAGGVWYLARGLLGVGDPPRVGWLPAPGPDAPVALAAHVLVAGVGLASFWLRRSVAEEPGEGGRGSRERGGTTPGGGGTLG
ncbi:MAG: hypothetical protein RJQ04_22245 [Longimicrobiales bacterium]